MDESISLISWIQNDKKFPSSELSDLSWKSWNFLFISRISAFLNSTSEDEDKNGDNNLFDKRRMDTLFREYEHNADYLRDVQVISFHIDDVLADFRLNQANITSEALSKMIRLFGLNEIQELKLKHREVYGFIMDHLNFNPPLYRMSRFFWISVVTEIYPYDQIGKEAIKKFSDLSYNIFKKSLRPYNYLLFLLTLLQYDYAAILNRVKSTTKRIHSIKEPEEFDEIPLAFLLVCNVDLIGCRLNEHSPDGHTYTDLMTAYHIHEDIHYNHLYGQLIGLLLDVQFFMAGFNAVDPDIEGIPKRIWDYVKKQVYVQLIDKKNDSGVRKFAALVNVPWVEKVLLTSFEKK